MTVKTDNSLIQFFNAASPEQLKELAQADSPQAARSVVTNAGFEVTKSDVEEVKREVESASAKRGALGAGLGSLLDNTLGTPGVFTNIGDIAEDIFKVGIRFLL